MNHGPERFFIGLGNANRRDCGVGLWLARSLAQRGAEALEAPGDPAALIEAMDIHSDVVLFGATQSGHPPGRITRVDATAGPVPAELFRHPSDRFGVGEVVETARSMGCLPPKLLLVGIEGQDFSTGTGLSPNVEWAAWQVLEEFARGA